jgi:hypothetical protein
VYDGKTGKVIHTHLVVVLPRAKGPTEEQINADALSLAGKFSKQSPQKLKVLNVKADQYEDGATYTVNVKSKELRKIPRKPAVASK